MGFFDNLFTQKPTLESVSNGIADVKTKLAQLESDIATIKNNPVQENEKKPTNESDVVQAGGARRSKKNRKTRKQRKHRR